MDKPTNLFRCVNRYGDIAEYIKIIEISNSCDDFIVIVYEAGEEVNFAKYNKKEEIPHLYELNNIEKEDAKNKFEMLKRIVEAGIHLDYL